MWFLCDVLCGCVCLCLGVIVCGCVNVWLNVCVWWVGGVDVGVCDDVEVLVWDKGWIRRRWWDECECERG